jgi:hypothetical protein
VFPAFALKARCKTGEETGEVEGKIACASQKAAAVNVSGGDQRDAAIDC